MKKNQAGLLYLWLGGMALLGGVLLYLISAPFGLGLIPDSIAYIQGAKHLALGQGYLGYDKAAQLMPNNWYPPGLSIFLALGWFLGLSTLEWARMLNSLLFGVNIFLVGAIVFYVTRAQYASLVSSGVFLTSVYMLQEHSRLISEPLFIMFLLGWVLAMFVFMRTEDRRFLYIAALCAGISGVVRYAGIPVIVACTGWLWIWGRQKKWQLDGVFFFLTAGILPAFLFIRNSLLTGHISGRSFSFLGLDQGGVLVAVNSFSEWLLPSRVPAVLRWLVLGVCCMALGRWVVSRWIRLTQDVRQVLSFMLFFVCVYLAGSVGFKMFTRGDFVLSSRLLAPVFTLMIIGVGIMTSMLLKPLTLMKKLAVGILIVFICLTTARSVQLARILYKQGIDYSSQALTASKLAETLRSLDDRVPLYSNKPEALYHLAGRPAVRIPWAGEDPSYFPAIGMAVVDFKEKHGIAVIFDTTRFVPSPSWRSLKESLGLEILMTDTAGDIYGVRKK